ncbi:hypothetical protein BX666DRAFT_1896447 [Dichotomocladium elegans]|nr:hypothetical protein BX666DRAFT_1896447 [Dichotomocladium elegans]
MSSSVSPLGQPSMYEFASSSPSYSAAFPPLQPIPISIPQQTKKTQHAGHPPALQHSLIPPKYPSYLKQTLYADLVLEQFQYLQIKRFPDKHHDMPFPDCRQVTRLPPRSTPLSFSFLSDDIDLRLPTFWNPKDKSRNIEIGRNGLDLTYVESEKMEHQGAAVRANFPIRPQCGIYYYEMRILSKGNDGYISIGISKSTVDTKYLPGLQPDSLGYHGNDGCLYSGARLGVEYGPGFTTGDTIGCGVNFVDNTVFFTKNGSFLPSVFHRFSPDVEYYPSVGLGTIGERATFNFGNEPFVFDITQYIKDRKIKVWKEINNNKLKTSKKHIKQSTAGLDELVMSYIVHHGYLQTAKALVKDITYVSGKEIDLPTKSSKVSKQDLDEADIRQRSNIRSAIITGDIDHAIELVNQYYPTMFRPGGEFDDLMFQLKCRKFVEMILQYSQVLPRISLEKHTLDNDHASVTSNGSANVHLSNGFDDDRHNHIQHSHHSLVHQSHSYLGSPEESHTAWGRDRRRSMGSSTTSTNHATSSAIRVPGRRRMSYAAIAASASPTSTISGGFLGFSASPPLLHDDHDHDDHHHIFTGRKNRRASTRRSSTSSSVLSFGSIPFNNHDEDQQHDLSGVDEEEDGTSYGADVTMKQIIKYGHKLQAEYRNDERLMIRTRLVEIFSLLAYPDASASPVAHLMDKSGRDELATDLNTAILAHQGYRDVPPLERIYRQTLIVNKESAYAGYGKSTIVDIQEYCTSNGSLSHDKAALTAIVDRPPLSPVHF